MPSPLRDERGLRGRVPERPGPLLRGAGRLYGPLSALAGALAARRQVRTRLPVLSVGNLEVGGTGKTPAVLAIAELLLAAGLRPALLTGLAGQARGRDLLVAGEPAFARDAPDEARLLAGRLPGLPLVAARRKWRGALRLDAIAGKGSDLILLDDGFQHRRLARRLDLLLLSAPPGRLAVLPAGPLREPASAVRRAHAILAPTGLELGALPPPAPPVFRFRVVVEGLVDSVGDPAEPDPEGYLAVSAIARPERFETSAEESCKVLSRIRFRDHAPWGPSMRVALAETLSGLPEARPLLTEKDHARWARDWDLEKKAPHVLRVRLDWESPEGLRDLLVVAVGQGREG